MSNDVVYTGQTYKLRSGAPMSKGAQGAGEFYLHTFMAERNDVDNYLYTESLPDSDAFRGQGGNYMSANFSRLNDRSGTAFSGKVIHNPDFVSEGEATAGSQGVF